MPGGEESSLPAGESASAMHSWHTVGLPCLGTCSPDSRNNTKKRLYSKTCPRRRTGSMTVLHVLGFHWQPRALPCCSYIRR